MRWLRARLAGLRCRASLLWLAVRCGGMAPAAVDAEVARIQDRYDAARR